jgi:lysozyme family protein
MSSENYESSLKRVLVHKGGYSNDMDDPGGATMWVITHIDYDAFRRLRDRRRCGRRGGDVVGG